MAASPVNPSWASTPNLQCRHTSRSVKPHALNIPSNDTETATVIPIESRHDQWFENWREHPALNLTLRFPTLLVPNEDLSKWMRDPSLKPFLIRATSTNILSHIHPRIRTVQPHNDTHKRLLLEDYTVSTTASGTIQETTVDPNLLKIVEKYPDESLSLGPHMDISITHEHLTFLFAITQLLPIPPPTTFEQIGHIAHFNLKPEHVPYGPLIGDVLRDRNPGVDTVVNKVGAVKGKYRVYDLEVLSGPANFQTKVVEQGVRIHLNVAECYWSTGLKGERQELLRIFRQTERKKQSPLVILDAFCGVGAVCLLVAKQHPGSKIFMNDWNPHAVRYLVESIEDNGMEGTAEFHISCGDAYKYLEHWGMQTSNPIPDHVLMNYPLEAPRFLQALRTWSASAIENHYSRYQMYPRCHLYTFAKPETDDLDHEETAVNLVADALFPRPPTTDESEEKKKPVMARRKEFDRIFGAEVDTRVVRDVSPSKMVVCVSFWITPELVRGIDSSTRED
eukprot:Nitzschia sp. Nitz4//scaffold447_size6557//4423//5943//NITZ4_009173-RA/size6557-processed-gene-0.1-mRNA-1//-1//CDS//3329552061//9451//frame0